MSVRQSIVAVVQSFSCLLPFVAPWTATMPGFPVLHHLPELLKFMSIDLVIPSHHLVLCHPLLLLLSIFPTIRVFSNESVLLIRWPKYWSFSFSIGPCNESSGLIPFRINWFDLLAVQWTLKEFYRFSAIVNKLSMAFF